MTDRTPNERRNMAETVEGRAKTIWERRLSMAVPWDRALRMKIFARFVEDVREEARQELYREARPAPEDSA